MAAPFHQLLCYYSRQSHKPETVRLVDSISGNLALGLDFPVALVIAIGRHLSLKNTGFFSFDIHIPSVRTLKTPLDGIPIDKDKEYSCSEIVGAARQNGYQSQADALGLWALASDVKTGLLLGEDVVKFQQGTLFTALERRRKDRTQVLPLYRGGPIWVGGHSWAVKTFFGVDVYKGGM